MKISATLTCQYDSVFSPFAASEFEAGLDWAVACKLDGVELCIADYRQTPTVDTMKAYAADIACKLAARRLNCSTISTGQAFGRENISLTHDQEVARNLAASRVMAHIMVASVLGSCVTIGLLRGTAKEIPASEATARMKKALQPCLEYAAKMGVCLLIEPINRYETGFINNTLEALDFINQMDNSSNLKILWDVFHANIEDASFAASIKAMGDRLGHVHLADSNRGFPMCGHLDFAAIFRALTEEGYAGWLSLECLDKPFAGCIRRLTPDFVNMLKGAGTQPQPGAATSESSPAEPPKPEEKDIELFDLFRRRR